MPDFRAMYAKFPETVHTRTRTPCWQRDRYNMGLCIAANGNEYQ